MGQPHSPLDQIVDIMIGLTGLTGAQRAIAAGSGSMDLCLALRRRGFMRVATTTTCRIPGGQHSVGLIADRNSVPAIEAALADVSRFLGASAAVAVLIDSGESGAGVRVRGRLEQIGFRIEAGVRCPQGFVLSAIRQGFAQIENAA